MKVFFLLLSLFVSFLYLSQNASAADYAYCDSRPNDPLSLCTECALPCDYQVTKSTPCVASDCRAGTVLVECPLITPSIDIKS